MASADLTQRFLASDGFSIAYRHWKATGPKRVVFCIHGVGDYSGWFRNIAPELAADGSEVYALDLRGFGESCQVGSIHGVVSDFNRHLLDIDDFVTYVFNHHAGLKRFLFGHSLGGVYAVWYAANHPGKIDGLVLAAPAVACNLNCVYSNRDRDPEEIAIMQNDPLETEVLSESYLSSVQRVLLDSALDNASRILVSTLVLQGKEDVMVKAEGIKQLYEALAASGKELVLFDDAGHWFYDALSPAPPRGKFDSAKRAQFIDTVVCWLRNH